MALLAAIEAHNLIMSDELGDFCQFRSVDFLLLAVGRFVAFFAAMVADRLLGAPGLWLHSIGDLMGQGVLHALRQVGQLAETGLLL